MKNSNNLVELNAASLSYSELRRWTLRKELENYEMFGALVNKFETIANRYEQVIKNNIFFTIWFPKDNKMKYDYESDLICIYYR